MATEKKQKATRPKDNTELQALQQKLAAIEEQLQQALLVNEKLTAEIEVLTEARPPEAAAKAATGNLLAMTFENAGIKYGFVIPQVIHKGILITPVEVCADAELQQQLIERKSGMIKAL